MKKSFEREIINAFLSGGDFGVYELAEQTQSNNTIWMLVSNKEQQPEIIVFADETNFERARVKLEEHINKSYVGSGGLNICLVLLTNSRNELISRENTRLNSSFVASTAAVQIDIEEPDIIYAFGSTYSVQGIFNFVNYKKRQKKAASSSKLSATNILIGINIAVFVIMAGYFTNLFFESDQLLQVGGLNSIYVRAYGQYYRLLTAMFLHSGIAHVAINMYGLKLLGSMIEKIYGSYKFIVIYLFSGLIGSVFSYSFSSPNSVGVGASGAIFGLLGSAVIYGLKMRSRIGKDFLFSIFQVIFLNLIIGFTATNIDNAAHIGGLIGGLIVTALLEVGRTSE